MSPKGMEEKQYVVVFDGLDNFKELASFPHSREVALTGFDRAVADLGPELASGGLRISVLSEAEYEKRADL